MHRKTSRPAPSWRRRSRCSARWGWRSGWRRARRSWRRRAG